MCQKHFVLLSTIMYFMLVFLLLNKLSPHGHRYATFLMFLTWDKYNPFWFFRCVLQGKQMSISHQIMSRAPQQMNQVRV